MVKLPDDAAYWTRVRNVAQSLDSDGCTGVPDFYADACAEHDVHYRTHQTIFGEPITRAEADAWLRRRIQQRSVFQCFSPMAIWRWVGVRLFGKRAWDHDDSGTPLWQRDEVEA